MKRTVRGEAAFSSITRNKEDKRVTSPAVNLWLLFVQARKERLWWRESFVVRLFWERCGVRYTTERCDVVLYLGEMCCGVY